MARMTTTVPLVPEDGTHKSLDFSASSLVNWYPVTAPPGAKAKFALYPTPGKKTFSTVNASGSVVRGLHVAKNVLYAVVDNKFYSVDSSGTPTELGTISTSTGFVSMANNGAQIMIVDGTTSAYTFTISGSTFAAISDGDFTKASMVTFQDGYGLYIEGDSGTIWQTALNDFTSITATDFATAEDNPDNIVAIISNRTDLWVLGEESSEVWYNAGNTSGLSFAPNPSNSSEFGCAAVASVAKADNTILWLTKNSYGEGLVVMAEGYVPKVISSEAVSQAITGYATISDAIGYTYLSEGRLFYVLTFPTEDKTHVYDFLTGMWHERKSTLGNAVTSIVPQRQGRDRGNCYAFAYGKHLVGDFESGIVFEMDNDTYTDKSLVIQREVTSPYIYDQHKQFTVTRIEADAEMGVGLLTQGAQGEKPLLMMSISDDGGHTFRNERYGSLGVNSAYGGRVYWNRLGRFRQLLIRLRISDPVAPILMGNIFVDTKQGVH
jgi:hypothetical protein